MFSDTGSSQSPRPQPVRPFHRLALVLALLVASVAAWLPQPAKAATNLALNKPALASASEAPGTQPNLAFDGNLGSRWSSGFSDPQWIRVDLGSVQSISQVTLRWEAAYGRAYQIQTSNDGNAWTTIASVTNGDGGVDDLAVSGSGRYVRLYGTVRATPYGYSLWEFEVYGGTNPTNTPVNPTSTPVPPTSTPLPPTPTPTQPGGSCQTTTNIGLNKPAYTWYYDTKDGAPRFGNDGNAATRWSHLWYPSGPATAWYYVDLGSTAALVNRVKISWEAALAADFQIQTSNDATTWTTVRSVVGNAALINDYAFSPAIRGRYVRINMTKKGTAYGYSFWELELHGCNAGSPTYPPPPQPATGTFTRVWVDNFDGTALNTANWAYDNNVHVNGEQQQYANGNVTVSGGTLKITARRETLNGYPFTSGRIFSKDLKTFTYGKMVARMKLPVGEGFWPAFWMMGNNIDTVGWPGNGELDIMENIGYGNWTSGALHGPGYYGAGSAGGLVNLPAGQTTADWHTYAVEWDPTYIKWLVDDREILSFTREYIINERGQWTYDNPKFFILNLALGGEYPAGYNGCTGNPLPAGCAYFGVKQSTVDAIVAGRGVAEIDYVEVWQKR
ncbi:MAG TPA: discoidin domain-containing protein [Herpetosiphonaceae bacterium]